MDFKKGDIFNDGVLGYWIFHPKTEGGELLLLPFDRFLNLNETSGGCQNFWHNPKTWNLTSVEVVCNFYENQEQAMGLIGDGNSMQERFISLFNSHSA